jgi:predicted TIM-barrel fold metal-dependent hydrolase
MIVDCHVHVCATTPGHGSVSVQLLTGLPFRFMRWRLGLPGDLSEAAEKAVAAALVATVKGTDLIDKAVVLAFDAVYDGEGRLDAPHTHLYVTNDYACELAASQPKLLFGASVHPYRKDAVAELERCISRGAVLLKWLPIVQDFNPADKRCFPFYDVLAHYRLPLLCHTGGERALPNLSPQFADPALLEPALKRGVIVIAAHCGTRSRKRETDYLPTFVRLAHEYEMLYGDTSALNLPARNYAYNVILKDEIVRAKLVHGSDWPIMALPPVHLIGLPETISLLLSELNWMRRDVLIKQKLGFDEAYWHRGATLLRIPETESAPKDESASEGGS